MSLRRPTHTHTHTHRERERKQKVSKTDRMHKSIYCRITHSIRMESITNKQFTLPFHSDKDRSVPSMSFAESSWKLEGGSPRIAANKLTRTTKARPTDFWGETDAGKHTTGRQPSVTNVWCDVWHSQGRYQAFPPSMFFFSLGAKLKKKTRSAMERPSERPKETGKPSNAQNPAWATTLKAWRGKTSVRIIQGIYRECCTAS
jgi:hypothetical protein